MARVIADFAASVGLVLLAATLAACGGGGDQASCSDGAKNGTESDVDCGGSCDKCGLGRDCVSDFDCQSGNCLAGACEPSGGGDCDDGVQNGYETDVDCGGTCPDCEPGQGCLVDADCASNNCVNGTCGSGGDTCNDGVLNGSESDVDCGGACTACADGSTCNANTDCTSRNCDNGTCQPGGGGTCNDGQLNQDESDVDCGGVCPACADGSTCNANTDCVSDNCDNGTCQPGGGETCDDGLLNQDETDTDCGGSTCGPCPNGADCLLDGDCLSDNCLNGICQPVQDECPDDPFKTVPGVCGCGTPDIDSDSDGSMDCVDGCPQDPAKIAPGLCGCGNTETDSDGDGSPDCVDPCPNDPANQCAGCNPMGWDGCPTGATEWCYPGSVDGTSSAQARAACEACFGQPCELRSGDCAGDGWGVVDAAVNPADATFGFAAGCSGPLGRIWDYGSSWTTYGYWAGMPASLTADPQTFSDPPALESTRMPLAQADNQLWASSGGSTGGVRLVQLDINGNQQAAYQPGIDMRSVFTRSRGVGPLLARGYASNQIRVQTSPGVFGNDVVLNGGSLDVQSAVVYDHVRGFFVALTSGVIHRWNNAGAYAGSIPLIGWEVDNPGESAIPQGRGLAVSHSGHYLTYHNQILSVWDQLGRRIYTTTLAGAGTSFDSYYSFSYTGPSNRGYVYVLDATGGLWRRWVIGL